MRRRQGAVVVLLALAVLVALNVLVYCAVVCTLPYGQVVTPGPSFTQGPGGYAS